MRVAASGRADKSLSWERDALASEDSGSRLTNHSHGVRTKRVGHNHSQPRSRGFSRFGFSRPDGRWLKPKHREAP